MEAIFAISTISRADPRNLDLEIQRKKLCKSCYNNLFSIEEALQRPLLQGDQSPLGGHPPQGLFLMSPSLKRGFSAHLFNFFLDIGHSLGLYHLKILGSS